MDIFGNITAAMSGFDLAILQDAAGSAINTWGPALAMAVLVFLIAEIVLLVIRHVLKPITAKTKTNLDDLVIDGLPRPVHISALLFAVWAFGESAFPLAQPFAHPWSDWFGGAVIASGGLIAARVANAVVRWYYQELAPQLRARHGDTAGSISSDAFPMMRRILVGLVYLITLTMLLGHFGLLGILMPLLAGLGIAGLAVGLALQDTLTNFFSGMQLLSNKPVRVGEYIALDNENGTIKGFVEEIGWSTTRIRTRGNSTYYVPNKMMCNTLIVNFSRGLDDNWKGSSLSVGVDYSSDPAQVEKIILETIRNLQKKDARFGVQEPMVRLDEFGESALVFKVMWTVHDFAQSEMVAAEVREAVLSALRAHNISIPYPTRVLMMNGRPSVRKTGTKRNIKIKSRARKR